MIWLTWRQFRLQALVAAAALAALAIGFGLTGPHLTSLYTQTCGTGDCSGAHLQQFLTAMKADGAYPLLYFAGGAVMYLAPLIIGVFWGAPLIARELQSGTHRLAWNQSVTRGRWLLVKLAVTAWSRWRSPGWPDSCSPGGQAPSIRPAGSRSASASSAGSSR
jgi:hypothetical protein